MTFTTMAYHLISDGSQKKKWGKRYVTEVVAEEIEFMGSAGQKEVVKAEKVDMNDWEPMDSDLDSLPF